MSKRHPDQEDVEDIRHYASLMVGGLRGLLRIMKSLDTEFSKEDFVISVARAAAVVYNQLDEGKKEVRYNG